MALALELHVGEVQDARAFDRHALACKRGPAFGNLRFQGGPDEADIERGQRLVDGIDVIVAGIGNDATERIGDAGPHRDQQLRNGELARQRRRMQGTRAAEREQHEVARIVAARERNHADRARHLVVGDAQYRRCGCGRIQPERLADFFQDDRAHFGERHRPVHGEQLFRIEPPQDQVGIGDGRIDAAAAVADRAGRGAGRFRADLQHAGLIDEGDRPAAGADGVHVHHGHMDGHGVFQLQLRGHGGHAFLDQRHVGGGAAHVVGDHVLVAGGGRGVGRGHHARGRTRHDRVHRVLGNDGRGHGAAVALHHQQVVAEPLCRAVRCAGVRYSARVWAAPRH